MMKHLKARKGFLVMALTLAAVLAFAIGHSKTVFATESESGNTVWLHVVNGNFSGSYNGKELSKVPSVEVELDADRMLPEEVKSITAVRTNGTFDGWYTRSAVETLEDREDGAYCVWHTERKNGDRIEPGSGKVPENVNVLYAVFNDKAEEDLTDGDKLVAYYLDWNGINGRYGHCLTSIRSYREGNAYLSAENAAVYHLNFRDEFQSRFDSADNKWEELKKIWEEYEFDGYTFLGWSDSPHGDTIWEDTKIKNGMSFYAQWKKGEMSSNDFEPGEDPDAGPLEFIRITGDGLNANLSASKHAKEGESMTLTMLRDPIRATAEDVTWNLSISNGGLKSEKVTVRAGETSVHQPKNGGAGLELKAEGYTLTVKNLDGGEYGVTVGVTAKAAGTDAQVFSAPAKTVLSFSHAWDRGEVTEEADCEKSGKIQYTCTVEGCRQEKEEQVSALSHVYEQKLEGSRYYEVLQEPTCTEEGLKQYKCLRCGQTNGTTASIPATGHNWKTTGGGPLDCQRTQYTDTCTNHDCGMTRTREVHVSNPAMHQYEETVIPMNCSKATLRKTCAVCGVTTDTVIDASNPDAPHVWGDWKTTVAPTLEAAGERTRICHLCQEEETKVLPQLSAGKYPAATGTDAAAGAEDADAGKEESGSTVKTGNLPEAVSDGKNHAGSGNAVKEEKAASAAGAEKQEARKESGKTGWQTIDGKKYYFDKKGVMKTGWQTIDGKKYYFDKKGVMKTGWQTISKKKYYFNGKGVMQSNGIKTIDGKKYYFDKKGVMKTGWQTIGKKKYYFNGKGVMQSNGIKTINGKKYYFDKKGVMKTGWQTISKKKYYFNGKGVMQSNGIKTINGKKYYFDKKGVMKTGTQKIGGKTYTFRSNGVLQK